ncbi:hypothetical protein E3_2010 [Rhodococcus phage E3]|uniref:hypothetical protein n=1 Tax=Rhodococcus phage E3 TaxID=1007869 RepID=UPI0002C6DFB1|nr:hypothetical protein M176_gp213 [Rhodococcus phage E3]AEQ21121.1 hypothetical protein E3_2010 [Rhodococcus phage E3]
MSYHLPANWSEILRSVQSGFVFRSQRIGVQAFQVAVCGDPRRELTDHESPFAAEIIESYDCLHRDYMCGGREFALRPTDVVYVVKRDGIPLAYVTREGKVKINRSAIREHKRCRDALRRLEGSLVLCGRAYAGRDKAYWL